MDSEGRGRPCLVAVVCRQHAAQKVSLELTDGLVEPYAAADHLVDELFEALLEIAI